MQSRTIYKVDVQPAHRLMQIVSRDGRTSDYKVYFNFTGAPAQDNFGMPMGGYMNWDWEVASAQPPDNTPRIVLNPEGWDFYYMGEYGRCLVT